MTTTKHDERIEALKEASKLVSSQAIEDLGVQGRAVAANMLLMYGDKSCTSATGFVAMCQQAHEVSLYWLLSEGYVTLTEKALATPEELAGREKPADGSPDENVLPFRPGSYL